MSVYPFKSSLQGEFINLLQVQPCHAEFIYNLRTSESAKYLNRPENYSLESQLNWIRTRTLDEINYVIYNTLDQLVGMVGIYDCNKHDKVSNCGRLLLDHKYVHNGSPYGLEALKICYGYIFKEMGYRKITGTIVGNNEKVVGLQVYLGMQCEGIMKKHALINEQYEDLYVYSLFQEDFFKDGGYRDRINILLNKYRSHENHSK